MDADFVVSETVLSYRKKCPIVSGPNSGDERIVRRGGLGEMAAGEGYRLHVELEYCVSSSVGGRSGDTSWSSPE